MGRIKRHTRAQRRAAEKRHFTANKAQSDARPSVTASAPIAGPVLPGIALPTSSLPIRTFMRGLQEPTSGEPLQSALEALDQAHYAIIAAKDALAQSQNSMPYQSYPAPLQPTGAVESQAPAESQFLVADSAAYAAFTPFAAPSVVSEWLSGIPADTSAIPAAIKGKQAYCGKCHLEGRDSETHSAQDCPFKAHREVKKAKHRVKNGAKKRRDRDRLEKFKEKKRGERWIKKAGDMILEDMGFKDMFEHPKKVEEESARAIEESWESFVEMLN